MSSNLWAGGARARICALVVACALAPQAAFAQEPKTFLWADADTTVHTSTRLQDVPEPYKSLYRAQLATTGSARAAGAAQATGLEGQRAHWQQKRAALGEALLQATKKWAEAKEHDEALDLNPVLRLTPMVQAQKQQGAKGLQEAKEAFLAARKALLVTFVQEAERAKIPASWLQ